MAKSQSSGFLGTRDTGEDCEGQETQVRIVRNKRNTGDDFEKQETQVRTVVA